jgi:hypothetical protein
MSADNWCACPKCRAKHVASLNRRRQRLNAQYGKIPADEYVSRLAAINSEPDEPPEDTFREDYELGLSRDGSEFLVSYRGVCTVCGFGHKFKHAEPVKVDVAAAAD